MNRIQIGLGCAAVLAFFHSTSRADVSLTLTKANVGASAADLAPYGSPNGAGIYTANIDDNIRTSHATFSGPGGPISVVDYSGGGLGDFSYHSTDSTSVMVGRGGGGVAAGLSPGAGIVVAKTSTDENTAQAILSQASSAPKTYVMNMSLGFGAAGNGTDQFSYFLDWVTNNYDFLMVKSAGNSGPGATTITRPGAAFNLMTVGALNEAFTQPRGSSSEGPVANRNKPEIVAPGENIRMANAFFPDNDGINGDFMDDNANGRIGLNLNTFRQDWISGVIFQDNVGNPVNSLSIIDSNADGEPSGDFIKDGNPGANWTDVNGNNQIDANDIIHSNLAFDANDDPDLDFHVSSGTSFAAPHVAGGAAIAYQYAKDNGKSTDHRVMKAALMAAADRVSVTDKGGNVWEPDNQGFDPLDDQLGAGNLQVDDTLNIYSAAALVGHKIIEETAWEMASVAANNMVDFAIDYALRGGSQVSIAIAWDRIVTRTAAGNASLLLDDTYAVSQFADLDLFLLDDMGNELALTDAAGQTSYSRSGFDPVELIYFEIPKNDSYSIRVKNLSGFAADFGFAYIGTPVPEPATLMLLVSAFALLNTPRRQR
jgi:hypothetical protein